MITGSTLWTQRLNAQNPRPLYVFSIPGLSITLCSFINQVFPSISNGAASITDLACAGSGSLTVTSATGGFQQWMIGYWLQIASGANFFVGSFLITGVTDTNTLTLATSPCAGAAGTGGHGKVTLAINADSFLPILQTPTGGSQSIDELSGHSSISLMSVTAIDNSGALKTLSANTNAIGQVCTFAMGCTGGDASNVLDFVPLEVKTIAEIGRDSNGLMTFKLNDLLMNLVVDIFTNGGPAPYTQFTGAALLSLKSSGVADKRQFAITGFDGSGKALNEVGFLNGTTEVLSLNIYTLIASVTVAVASQLYVVTLKQGSGGTTISTVQIGSTSGTGQAKPVMPPTAPALLDDGLLISQNNPRFISGNPMDIVLAVMQNELGVGQATPPVLVVTTGGGSGTGQVGYGISPLWQRYTGVPGDGSLINPNTYLDVPNILTLRNGEFSGDRMEFVLTGPTTGKTWLENQILQPLGLVWVTRANGQLYLKSTKTPATYNSKAISNRQIDGIPQLEQFPIINMIRANVPNTDSSGNSDQTRYITFANQTSLTKYKAPYISTLNADGLRLGFGGFQKLFLTANRIFNRHANGTPEYTFTAFLNMMVMEVGEYFILTHSLVLDKKSGTLGITNVLCEITSRQPDYANGKVTYKCIDTRFISTSNGFFQIAANGLAVPVYGSASAGQRALYLFVTLNTGLYSNGNPGNQIS